MKAQMQKGFTLNGRTIRAAMVTVAKAKGYFSPHVNPLLAGRGL